MAAVFSEAEGVSVTTSHAEPAKESALAAKVIFVKENILMTFDSIYP
jgi:hypothetical protein